MHFIAIILMFRFVIYNINFILKTVKAVEEVKDSERLDEDPTTALVSLEYYFDSENVVEDEKQTKRKKGEKSLYSDH